MDEAILYDLIAEKTIYKWRDEAEKSDNCIYRKSLDNQRDLLNAAVGENNLELVRHFELAADNYWSYVFYCVDVKLINTCIKIGMELQKFYDESRE